MNLEEFDWLDYSLFLLLASAEVTDHYLTETEINTILEKAEGLVSKFKFEETPFVKNDILVKFYKCFDWYDAIGESAPENNMSFHIMQQVFKVVQAMKIQRWFSADFGKALLNDLVTLADADGETIKNEQQLINRIADEWDLEKPFS